MSSSDQEFTPEEADAILKRAVGLQVEHSQSPDSVNAGDRISLQQLYRSAEEIGVEATHVRQAAEEVAGRSLSGRKRDPGEQTVLKQEFQVEVKQSDFPDMLEHLRTVTRSQGASQMIGGSLQWQTTLTPGMEMVYVTIMPLDGITRVVIRTSCPFKALSRWMMAFSAILVIGLLPLVSAIGLLPLSLEDFWFFKRSLLEVFVAITAVTCLIPFIFGQGWVPWRKRRAPGEVLAGSVAVWMDQLRASRL